jgi:hypothetical protein
VQATRPKDGEIKGREVRRRSVVLFQGFMSRFRKVRDFSAPRRHADFLMISCV